MKRVVPMVLCVVIILTLFSSCAGRGQISLAECEDLYAQFMDSRQWQTVDEYGYGSESEEMQITEYKIFDFDGNGIPELLFHAEDADMMGVRGPARRDLFCTIEDGVVKQLLSCYVSGGSIGGNQIVFGYDTETKTHVVCESGYGGGFMGSMAWDTIYELNNAELRKTVEYSQTTQVAENYVNGELDKPGLFYPSDMDYGKQAVFTVYMINDEQVSEEAYYDVNNRFVPPIDKDLVPSRWQKVAVD